MWTYRLRHTWTHYLRSLFFCGLCVCVCMPVCRAFINPPRFWRFSLGMWGIIILNFQHFFPPYNGLMDLHFCPKNFHWIWVSCFRTTRKGKITEIHNKIRVPLRYFSPMLWGLILPDKPQFLWVTHINTFVTPRKNICHDKAICHLKTFLMIHYTSYYTTIW